jgi:hypothetical protein
MIRMSIQLCVITWIVMMCLFVFIFVATGEYDAVVPMLTLMTAICAGLWVLMLLVMLVFFGNRMPMRFTIRPGGITCDITSKRSKWANRLLIIMGILARKPGAVGTGILAVTQESQTFEWNRVHAVTYNEKRRVITLRNRWRSLLMIFCLPENYREVLETVTNHIPRRPRKSALQKHPVARLIVRTFLTALACLPIFQLEYPFEVDLFVSIFILCFAMATIWLVPLFGYVVIAAVIYVTIVIIVQGAQIHTSQYSFLGSYRGFELIHGEEWAGMVLLGAALVYLIWSSWRAIKGKDESALFLD